MIFHKVWAAGCLPSLVSCSFSQISQPAIIRLYHKYHNILIVCKRLFLPGIIFHHRVIWPGVLAPLSLLGGSHSLHAPHRGEALDMVMFTIILWLAMLLSQSIIIHSQVNCPESSRLDPTQHIWDVSSSEEQTLIMVSKKAKMLATLRSCMLKCLFTFVRCWGITPIVWLGRQQREG